MEIVQGNERERFPLLPLEFDRDLTASSSWEVEVEAEEGAGSIALLCYVKEEKKKKEGKKKWISELHTSLSLESQAKNQMIIASLTLQKKEQSKKG